MLELGGRVMPILAARVMRILGGRRMLIPEALAMRVRVGLVIRRPERSQLVVLKSVLLKETQTGVYLKKVGPVFLVP